MDVDILREALTVYIGRMDENVKDLKRAVAHNEMGERPGAELIKTFGEQKERAMKARSELTTLYP